MPKFQDPVINESSGCAIDIDDADLFYTINDENGPVYAVDRSSGALVGKCGVNRTTIDTEAICMAANGNLWLADSGANGNHVDRETIALLWRQAFGRHYPGTLNWNRATFQYPDGTMRNCEAFIVNPLDVSWRYFLTKTSPGRLYRTPLNIESGNNYNLVYVQDLPISYVSDACYTPDGSLVLCRRDPDHVSGATTTIWVLSGDTFELVGTITGLPSMSKSEGVGVTWDQLGFTITNEGAKTTFYNEPMPLAYRQGPGFSPCG